MHRSTQRVISTVILVIGASAFVALATVAMLTNHEVLAGTFGLLALFGFTLAALAPRIHGEVKASLSGFSFELVREIVDTGRRTDARDEVVLAAIRHALDHYETVTPDVADEQNSDDTHRDSTSTDSEAVALLAEARRNLSTR